jgi:hypothetical protein
MTPAPRSGTGIVVLVMLVVVTFAVLLVTAALHLTNQKSRDGSTRLDARASGILSTAVPTVGHVFPDATSALPTHSPDTITQPTLLANPSAGLPVFAQAAAPLTIPGPLVDPTLSLFTGPVAVPLEMQIPALDIQAPVLGVGLTLTNVMASPRGNRVDDPIWQSVFWYRGGGIPGDVGTATFAGHFDDGLGRPAIFAYLGELRTGDLIVVRDVRSEVEIPFIVTETQTYTDEEAADPATLERIFGSQSVSGSEAASEADQISRLTLITCAGAWVDGSFNLRLVVYATRASYPSGLGG